MIIKRVVGKVVVGALLVVGAVAVGSAFAQLSSPYVTNGGPSMAQDVKQGGATMPIVHQIDLRAVVYTYSPVEWGEAVGTAGVDTLSDSAIGLKSGKPAVMGNVGFLYVETNYHAWDILVRRQNGGYLMRDPYIDDIKLDTLGAYDSIVGDDTYKGVWQATKYDTTKIGGVIGVALKYNDGTANSTNKECPLKFAIGVVDTAGVKSERVSRGWTNRDSSIINAELLFGFDPASTNPDSAKGDYASFAYSLAKSKNTTDLAKESQYFDTSVL